MLSAIWVGLIGGASASASGKNHTPKMDDWAFRQLRQFTKSVTSNPVPFTLGFSLVQ
jgi:hypothetical protein